MANIIGYSYNNFNQYNSYSAGVNGASCPSGSDSSITTGNNGNVQSNNTVTYSAKAPARISSNNESNNTGWKTAHDDYSDIDYEYKFIQTDENGSGHTIYRYGGVEYDSWDALEIYLDSNSSHGASGASGANRTSGASGASGSGRNSGYTDDWNTFANPDKAVNGMKYDFYGVTITYRDGCYSANGYDSFPQNIYGLTFQIKQDILKADKEYLNKALNSATTTSEKQKAVENYVKTRYIPHSGGMYDATLNGDCDFSISWGGLSGRAYVTVVNGKNEVRFEWY